MNTEKFNEEKYERFLMGCFTVFAFLIIIKYRLTRDVIFLRAYVPWLIYSIGVIVGLICFYSIRKYCFSIREGWRSYLSGVCLIKHLFFSALVFGSLCYGIFDVVNYTYTRGQSPSIADCKISRISIKSGGSGNTISFVFRGQTHSFSKFVSNEELRNAAKNKIFSNYTLRIEYKEGLWSSNLIEGWSLENNNFL